MVNIYSLLKLLHIVAVIVFLGNIITGLYWMRQANKTNSLAIISFTIRGIINSDKWFTIPGVIIITAGGIATAVEGGIPLLKTGWIFWSIVLFAISGIIFGVRVAPLQKMIFRISLSNENEFDRSLFQSKLKQWEFWGFLALITPVVALAMMVLKIPARSIF